MHRRKLFIRWQELLATAVLVSVCMVSMNIILVTFSNENTALNNRIEILSDKLAAAKEEVIKAKEEIVQFEFIIDEPLDLSKEKAMGLRYNNPGNIKANNWLGQIAVGYNGFAVFSHYSYGLRAIRITLEGYQDKYNDNTLRKIIHRYCPKNSVKYAKYIGDNIGVKIDDVIDVRDYMPEIIKLIIVYETGKQPYPEHAFALIMPNQ